MMKLDPLDFIRTVFRDLPAHAVRVVAGFPEDPNKTIAGWTARPVNGSLPTQIKPNCNAYYSIASIQPDPAGKVRRSKETVSAVHVIVVDDIGANGKVPAETITLEPSFAIETSPDNFQYGYLLDVPATNEEIMPVLHALARGQAGDRGGQNVARYVRLPFGVNTKAAVIETYGKPFPVTLKEWHPERRFAIAEVIAGLAVNVETKPPEKRLSTVKTTVDDTGSEHVDLAEVHKALALCVEEADDRDGWIKFGQALHRATGGSGAGFDLWDGWSQRSPKYKSGETKKLWRGLGKSCADPATLASIFAAARNKPCAAEDFEDDGVLAINFTRPYDVARVIIRTQFTHPDGDMLLSWQETFYAWTGSHYAPMPTEDLRALIYARAGSQAKQPPSARKVSDVVDALKAVANLSKTVREPAWLDASPVAADMTSIAMQNGILIAETRELLPATPRYFCTGALPFPYVKSARVASRWLAFLHDLWGDDTASIALLQQWFGYCLTARTEQQKALMIVGPPRSGKGTIARVLSALVGADNLCAPTLSGLAQGFGLAPLIGKQLAIISDARISGRADLAALSENILRIAGEDLIGIPRKYQSDFTAKLATKIMILSNELPHLPDAAGALASRFLILHTMRSFLAKEDHGLDKVLSSELPGIFEWALEGFDALAKSGRFVQPSTANAMIDELNRLASPVRAFLDDECEIAPGAEVERSALYAHYLAWGHHNGIAHPVALEIFGRNLRAAVSGLNTVQHKTRDGRGRVRFYQGLKLRAQRGDFDDCLDAYAHEPLEKTEDLRRVTQGDTCV